MPQASALGESMFPRSGYSRAISAEFGEIDQRLRALERQLERVGRRSAVSAAQAAEGVGETVASALNGMAERLRGGAHSMRDEAAKIGSEAAQRGNDTARPLAHGGDQLPPA